MGQGRTQGKRLGDRRRRRGQHGRVDRSSALSSICMGGGGEGGCGGERRCGCVVRRSALTAAVAMGSGCGGGQRAQERVWVYAQRGSEQGEHLWTGLWAALAFQMGLPIQRSRTLTTLSTVPALSRTLHVKISHLYVLLSLNQLSSTSMKTRASRLVPRDLQHFSNTRHTLEIYTCILTVSSLHLAHLL